MGEFKNTSTSSLVTNNVIRNNTNTSLRQSIIGNTTNSMINRVTDNPYTFFTDQSMTTVTFYNINKQFTTLDERLENTYNTIGDASGLRFDKINGVVLYGMGKIELNIDVGEFGTEADPIEGEAVLPPNTFIPYQESFFTIDHLMTKKTLWFRVVKVNIDTLPNGNNYYKIEYKLETIGDNIMPQVIREYMYNADAVGLGATGSSGGIDDATGMNPNVVVDSTLYNLSNQYAELVGMLQKFYYEMFFQESTQTFVFKYGMYGTFFYDPYLINFAIRNKLLNYNGYRYINVQQPAVEPLYMNMDYEHTIFRKFEDTKAKLCFTKAYGILVQDPMSLLSQRIEPYYQVTVRDDDGYYMGGPYLEPLDYFDTDLMNLIPGMNPLEGNKDPNKCECDCMKIINNLDKENAYYKLIHTYLNGGIITPEMIESIRYICFNPCKELYYTIPILIYIVRYTLSNLAAMISAQEAEAAAVNGSSNANGTTSLRANTVQNSATVAKNRINNVVGAATKGVNVFGN